MQHSAQGAPCRPTAPAACMRSGCCEAGDMSAEGRAKYPACQSDQVTCLAGVACIMSFTLIAGEYPSVKDWETHLTTIFPEIRLKRYLEMRGADGGPWANICALPALWVRPGQCAVPFSNPCSSALATYSFFYGGPWANICALPALWVRPHALHSPSGAVLQGLL